MNDIADFEKEYRDRLEGAIADAGMPPALLAQFSFDSCLREGRAYMVTRKADGAKGLLHITDHGPGEGTLEEPGLPAPSGHPESPQVYASYAQANRRYTVRAVQPG